MSASRSDRRTPARVIREAVFCLMVTAAAWIGGCVPSGPLPIMPPNDLLARVLATPGARKIQASGSLQVTSPDGVYNTGLLLFYQHPDSMKAMVQIGFGTTIAEIAITGSSGIAYLPQQRQATYLDAGTALMLGNATVYPLLLTRLMAPVGADDLLHDSLEVIVGQTSYYLRDASPAGIRTWKIGGRSGDLEAEDFASAESTITWHRAFAVQRNQRVPNYLSVQFGETVMTVHLNRIDVSPEWNSDPFTVRLPEGMEPVRMDSY